MIDLLTAITGIELFIFFVFFHILVLRIIKHKGVLKWTFYSVLISGILGISIFSTYFKLVGLINTKDLFVFVVFSFLIFFTISAFYIFALFGISTTSLRIRMLRILYNDKKKSMTKKELLRVYNLDILISDSLRKLVESGEIVYEKNKYHFKNVKSFYNLYNCILTLYYKLLE